MLCIYLTRTYNPRDIRAIRSYFCPGMLLPSFFTCVKVPFANHLSFAACTLCAADKDGVAISSPCTGVNDSEVDVPELASADSDLPSCWVRSLLALDSLA